MAIPVRTIEISTAAIDFVFISVSFDMYGK